MKTAASLVLAFGARGVVHAECPETKAVCVLQREATELLLDGKYAAAAERFRASIATEPSARAYLGYAQAVEGLGQLGFAYEMMAAAREFSAGELRADPDDIEARSRAERIKYKLADLRTKVGFVRLQLPAGIDPSVVVAVSRKDHGEIRDPLTRAVPVAPQQVLVVVLRSGAQLEITAAVSAGSEATLAVPIAVSPPALELPVAMPVVVGSAKASPPPVALALGVDALVLVPNVGNVGSGYGAQLRFERRISDRFAWSSRVGFALHPTAHYAEQDLDFSGSEAIALTGVRTSTASALHAALELGAVIYDESASAPAADGRPALMEDYLRVYPAVSAGLGLRLGRFALAASLLYAPPFGADIALPIRVAFGVGYDLVVR